MIYILDDDQATRDSLRLLLECDGLAAREFASGCEFLRIVRPEPGDCLLLDLQMPGMSGFEVLETLRHRGSGLPAIIVTGQPSTVAERRAKAAGALAVISKPYRADELLSLIRIAVGGPAPEPAQ